MAETVRDLLNHPAPPGDRNVYDIEVAHREHGQKIAFVLNMWMFLDLFILESRLNVSGTDLEVRPPAAPTALSESAGSGDRYSGNLSPLRITVRRGVTEAGPRRPAGVQSLASRAGSNRRLATVRTNSALRRGRVTGRIRA